MAALYVERNRNAYTLLRVRCMPTMMATNTAKAMILAGHENASQTTGPTLSSSISPAQMTPPPMAKPSVSFHGLFQIIILDCYDAAIFWTYNKIYNNVMIYSSISFPFFLASSIHFGTIWSRNLFFLSTNADMSSPM